MLMKFKEVTDIISGCAYRVYNQMGFGFFESVYEKCLMIELHKTNLKAEAQVPIRVYYDNENVGKFIVDILVEKEIILELKSVNCLNKTHEIQLVNYLVATHKDVGLILNFSEKKVEVKRKVRQLKR